MEPSADQASDTHPGSLVRASKSSVALVRSATTDLLSKSQILMPLSVPAHNQYLFGENVKQLMIEPASNEYNGLPSFKSHNIAVPSCTTTMMIYVIKLCCSSRVCDACTYFTTGRTQRAIWRHCDSVDVTTVSIICWKNKIDLLFFVFYFIKTNHSKKSFLFINIVYSKTYPTKLVFNVHVVKFQTLTNLSQPADTIIGLSKRENIKNEIIFEKNNDEY